MVSYPLLKTDFVSYLMVLHSIVQSFSSKKLKIISLVLLVLPANTFGPVDVKCVCIKQQICFEIYK